MNKYLRSETLFVVEGSNVHSTTSSSISSYYQDNENSESEDDKNVMNESQASIVTTNSSPDVNVRKSKRVLATTSKQKQSLKKQKTAFSKEVGLLGADIHLKTNLSNTEIIETVLDLICRSYLKINLNSTSSKSYGGKPFNNYKEYFRLFPNATCLEYTKRVIHELELMQLAQLESTIHNHAERLAMSNSNNSNNTTTTSSSHESLNAFSNFNKMELSFLQSIQKHYDPFPLSFSNNNSTAKLPSVLNIPIKMPLSITSTHTLPYHIQPTEFKSHCNSKLLILLIHNIDGDRLCYHDTQSCLSLLADCPYIRIIASCNHLNTSLLWDSYTLPLFHWHYCHTPTFVPTPIVFDEYSLAKKKYTKNMLSKSSVSRDKQNNDPASASGLGAVGGMSKEESNSAVTSIWLGLSDAHKTVFKIILEWWIRAVEKYKKEFPMKTTGNNKKINQFQDLNKYLLIKENCLFTGQLLVLCKENLCNIKNLQELDKILRELADQQVIDYDEFRLYHKVLFKLSYDQLRIYCNHAKINNMPTLTC